MKLFRTNRIRSQRGSLGVLFLLVAALIMIGLLSFAVDVAHIVCVRTELQNACDAAAMAGAQDLSVAHEDCEAHALAVAEQNLADGWAISNESSPVDIDVEVTELTVSNPGTVRVTASIESNHLWSKIFNRHSDIVRATALAGGYGSLTEADTNNLFPLVVSLDSSKNGFAPALNTVHVGESFNLLINSQQFKNAAFTSFTEKSTNNNWISNAIDQAIGLTPKEAVTIPPVSIGDNIYLSNGVLGQKSLAKDPQYGALMDQDVIYIGVVEGAVPFNQTRPLVGFVGVKVTAITTNGKGGQVETLTVKLIKGLTTGTDGMIPKTSSTQSDNALSELSPYTCKLLE